MLEWLRRLGNVKEALSAEAPVNAAGPPPVPVTALAPVQEAPAAEAPVVDATAAEAAVAASPKTPNAVYIADFKSRIDVERWNALRDHWAEVERQTFHKGYVKYFDIERWLNYALYIARWADLMGTSRERILDIGCGSGMFGRVCIEFGHKVTGIDVGNPMFMQMCEVLGVDCRVAPVYRNQRLPEELNGYDLITAISPKFYLGEKIDGRLEMYNWNDADWDFFLGDIRSRLRPQGRVLIRFNSEEKLPPGVWRRLEHARRFDQRTFTLERDGLLPKAEPIGSAVA